MATEQQVAAARQELASRELSRRQLRYFVRRTYPNFKENWHHLLLFERLQAFSQAVADGKSPRLIVEMPPRHTKSTIVSQRFPVWHMGRNPSHDVVCASYGQTLANKHSRAARSVCADSAMLWPGVALDDSRKAVEEWQVASGGTYRAVGVGGGLTGMGAHVAIIDDPIKDWREAQSALVRQSVQDWYDSVLTTRLAPGAGVLVTQCMTGDTPVLTRDRTTVPLRDIRPGDEVFTYDNGRISTSVVTNHKCCGLDSVFRIMTTSGLDVRANARHPFLVVRDGALSWVRLRDLRVGDAMLRVSGSQEALGLQRSVRMTGATGSPNQGGIVTATIPECIERTLSATTASGLEKHAAPTGAPSLPGARGCARLTTTQSPTAKVAKSERPNKIETPNSGIATAFEQPTTMPCSRNKAAFAPSASARQRMDLRRTGEGSCASTTATIRARSEGFFATTATSRSEGSDLQWSSKGLSITFVDSITPDGEDLVYDIEVDRTENFIANGLVSHNTRWHAADLAGWLQSEGKPGEWEVLSLPAIAEKDEPPHRLSGAALHPERYSLARLEELRDKNPMMFAALYQQRPTPAEGGIIRADWLRLNRYAERSHPSKIKRIIHSWDTASKKGELNDPSLCWVLAERLDGAVEVWDRWKGRVVFPDLIDQIKQLADRDKPHVVLIEDKGSGQEAIPQLRRDPSFRFSIVPAVPTSDKQTRMAAETPALESGRVLWPERASWLADAWEVLLTFPAHAHDEEVDALSQALHWLRDGADVDEKVRALYGWG